MALVAPAPAPVLFGVSEFGLAWVSGNRLEGAVSTAARTGSSSGSVADADRNILLALKAALPQDLRANVIRVVVYESDADGDPTNSACLTNAPAIRAHRRVQRLQRRHAAQRDRRHQPRCEQTTSGRRRPGRTAWPARPTRSASWSRRSTTT